MKEINEISFQMIADTGSANALYLEAVAEAKRGNIKAAGELLKKGESCHRDSHKVHAELIMKMAGGEEIPIDMILMHAEDQLMNAEVIKLLAEQVIELCQLVIPLKERVDRLESCLLADK